MKTQVTKLTRTKARYTQEYKKGGVGEPWRASGRNAATVAGRVKLALAA